MANVRKAKRSRFTSLSNGLLQDSNLSFSCRGMMAYLLSKPTDWETRPEDIEREGGIGRDARRSIMKEAEMAGYLTFHTSRKPNGHFENWYDAHEEPVPETERTASWETGKAKTQPGTENPLAAEAERGTGQPLPVEPPAGEPGVGQPVPLIKKEVQKTDLQKTERERPESASKTKLALVSSVGENPQPANQPFSPNDDFSQPAPKQEWSIAERFVLKACSLWDDLADQEKPVVETNWKTKQAVQSAGKYVAARLNVKQRIGGTPKMFLEFWHDTLKRSIAPRPEYVVEQWEAYDRWLVENYETHRRSVAA